MADFESLVRQATEIPFSGWDFSAIEKRLRRRRVPWEYARRVKNRIPLSRSLLDLGTGGGELLASLAPLPHETYATEGYRPNLRLARARLEPLGVQVLFADQGGPLPIPSHSIDLVADRHTGFSPAEVSRVLRPGGRFVTQQVGAANYGELNACFGVEPPAGLNDVLSAEALAHEVKTSGLEIVEKRDARLPDEFLDIAAVVYYLKAVPWQVPGFSVEAYRKQLRQIHSEIERGGRFRVTAHRILLVADKP